MFGNPQKNVLLYPYIYIYNIYIYIYIYTDIVTHFSVDSQTYVMFEELYEAFRLNFMKRHGKATNCTYIYIYMCAISGFSVSFHEIQTERFV